MSVLKSTKIVLLLLLIVNADAELVYGKSPNARFEISSSLIASKREVATRSISQRNLAIESLIVDLSKRPGVNIWGEEDEHLIKRHTKLPGNTRGSTAIVIADDLRLDDFVFARNRLKNRHRNGKQYRNYSHANWSNLTLVVNQLTISGCNLIDVSGESYRFSGLLTSEKCKTLSKPVSGSAWVNSDRRVNARVASTTGRYLSMGGQVSIFVRRLVCEPDSKLIIDSSSKDNSQNQKFRGGNIGVFIESIQGENCIKTRSRGALGGKQGVVAQATSIDEIGSEWRALKQAISFWKLYMLNRLTNRLIIADAQENTYEIAKQYHLYKQIAAYPIITKHASPINKLMQELNSNRNELLPHLVQKQIEVSIPGVIQRPRVNVVVETKTFGVYAIPNIALLVPQKVNSSEYLGLIEFDPHNENEILLWLEVDLGIDPFLESLLKQSLLDEGWQFNGQFSDWILKPAGLDGEVEGLNSASITPKADGKGFSISLRLNSSVSNIFLSRLTSQAGLPLVFDWQYRYAPAVTGNWSNLSVTTARRRSDALKVKDDELFNSGVDPIKVNYVKHQAGFEYLNPAKHVAAKSGSSFGAPKGQIEAVPHSAIEYETSLNSQVLAKRFFVADKDVVLQTVTIENLLSYDEDRGPIKVVEVYVSFQDDSGVSKTQGPIRLSPAGSDGDSKSLLFFGSASNGEFTLNGKAFFEHGSYYSLHEIETKSPVIKIRANTLPSIRTGDL